MSIHEIRLPDHCEALLEPLTGFHRLAPTALIEVGITDMYHEYKNGYLSQDGFDPSGDYQVDPDYDPELLDVDNSHVIELSDVVSLFFAREVGNVLPDEGMAIDRRLSVLAGEYLVALEHVREMY